MPEGGVTARAPTTAPRKIDAYSGEKARESIDGDTHAREAAGSKTEPKSALSEVDKGRTESGKCAPT